jgi:hypothetical protein
VVFLGPRANGELVPRFRIALRAPHVAHPMAALKILPSTNVTLTFDFDFRLDHPAHGGEGALHEKEKSNCQTKTSTGRKT